MGSNASPPRAGDLRQLNLHRGVWIITSGNETCVLFLLNESSELE